MTKRKIIAVAVVVGLCLGVVVTRAVWEGRSALTKGDEAAERGDSREAIRWWRRAARWYVPLAPHVGSAYERLEAQAVAAEAAGDRETALAAWRGIRGSVLATRSFYTPHSERLAPANRRIAELMAETEEESVAPGQDHDARTRWHYDLLQRDESPSVLWSIVALLGFGVWIAGGVLMALRGIGADDRLVVRVAARAGAMVAGGLVIWVLGLYNA